jgi:hypothetical protein
VRNGKVLKAKKYKRKIGNENPIYPATVLNERAVVNG